MSTERPSSCASVAVKFQRWLVHLHDKGPQDPIVQALYKRIGTAFSDVKDNMSTNLADELAYLTCEKMLSTATDDMRANLTLDLVRNITRYPAYHVLKDALASGLSINFPDWFFFATVYGPNHTALQPFHD